MTQYVKENWDPGDVDDVVVERFLAGKPFGRHLYPNEEVAVTRILRERAGAEFTKNLVMTTLHVGGKRAQELVDATDPDGLW